MYEVIQNVGDLELALLDGETIYIYNISDPDGNHFHAPIIVDNMRFSTVLNYVNSGSFYKKIN